jgi:hypothetical protein
MFTCTGPKLKILDFLFLKVYKLSKKFNFLCADSLNNFELLVAVIFSPLKVTSLFLKYLLKN